MRRFLPTFTALTASAVLLAGCVGEPKPDAEELAAETALPAEQLTVLGDADPVASAVATSRALFSTSPLVVTAPADDPAAQAAAASAAVALGAPLLLTSPGSDSADPSVEEELTRLDATTVLRIGDPDAANADSDSDSDSGNRTVLDADPADLIDMLPGSPRAIEVPEPAAALAAVAGLTAEDTDVLTLVGSASADGTSADAAGEEAGDLPDMDRGEPQGDGMLLAIDEPASLAGVATARAAGVAVSLVPADRPNPQASSELITALSEASPAAVLALGPAFGAEPSLDWKVRSAMSGVQLPAGGQLLFPDHMFVALYGTPDSPVLGVLGEQGLPETLERARDTAAPYAALSDRTVVPMLEIITTVAAGDAGPDGDYSNEISIDTLRPWVEAAGDAGMYVVLDLQPGRTDFLTQAKLYQPLLELPHVGLALDPEWRLKPDGRHLVTIGSVGAAEVNSVVTWLADLTAEKALPQKLLVLHQFQLRMISDRAAVDTSRDELAILIHVDGQGSQPAKQETWRVLHQGAPEGVTWGWKNFYDEDLPPLTPQQTMSQVEPTPELVTYQ
ncbi:hypothetical protein [Planctomonas psychrotolerans]|uniref:hypothetical protein n=1 Tax=Planctomonas psychrotolerans TaxID=2528712 RepID=UPI0012385E72|nr:hypothetical protein [Planctomonas psychrotolerans]